MVVLTYFLFLINPLFSLIFIIIGLLKDRKNNVHYSFLLAGVLACLAYWVEPRFEIDLTRYFEQLELFERLSWNDFTQTILFNDILYIVKNLLFYGISQTNNFHLLPMFVIWVSYFIMTYMLTDYANRTNVSTKQMIFALVFLLCVMPFISLVSNVRNILAFSIISLGIYRELIQGKRNILTYLCYILPLFIHISSLALIGLRIIVQVSSKKKWVNFVAVIFVIGIGFFLYEKDEILRTLPYVGTYFGSFLDQAQVYLNDSSSAEYIQFLKEDTFSKLQKTYFISSVTFLLLLSVMIKTKNEHTKLDNYIKYLSYVVIACIPIILTVYFRFTMAFVMFAFIVIFKVNNIKSKEWRTVTYACLCLILAFGLMQQTYFFHTLASITDAFYHMIPRSIFNMFNA